METFQRNFAYELFEHMAEPCLALTNATTNEANTSEILWTRLRWTKHKDDHFANVVLHQVTIEDRIDLFCFALNYVYSNCHNSFLTCRKHGL